MSHSRIKASIKLVGFAEDPDSITDKLGRQPSRSWRKGDRVPGTSMRRPTNGWAIDSDAGENATFEEHLDFLVSEATTLPNVIGDDGKLLPLQFSFAIYINDGNAPAIFVPPQCLKRVANLNISLDIDLYVL